MLQKAPICAVLTALMVASGIAASTNHSQTVGVLRSAALVSKMKAIESKLNSVGLIEYASHGHDSRNGHDWTNRFKDEASNVKSDPATCEIRYHWFTSADGQVNMDRDTRLRLETVGSVKTSSREEIFNADNHAHGNVSWTARVSPAVYVVTAQKKESAVKNHFVFRDADSATEFADLLKDAAKMCGAKLGD